MRESVRGREKETERKSERVRDKSYTVIYDIPSLRTRGLYSA